jgi:hypothetical protein
MDSQRADHRALGLFIGLSVWSECCLAVHRLDPFAHRGDDVCDARRVPSVHRGVRREGSWWDPSGASAPKSSVRDAVCWRERRSGRVLPTPHHVGGFPGVQVRDAWVRGVSNFLVASSRTSCRPTDPASPRRHVCPYAHRSVWPQPSACVNASGGRPSRMAPLMHPY